MGKYSVATDYEYGKTHMREAITVWSGQFCQEYEATGLSLPGNAGYMLTRYNGDKLRVECPCPRNESNYTAVDAAVCNAMENADRSAAVRAGMAAGVPLHTIEAKLDLADAMKGTDI